MNDIPRPAQADDEHLIAAYLDAELDAEAVAAFEARLAAERRLAADVETERELREILGGVAVPAPPAGFSERLAERLRVEGHAPADADAVTAAAAGPAAPAVTSLARERARRRPLHWGTASGVAAALVAVTVVGAGVLSRGGGDADLAMDTAADAGSAREYLADESMGGGAALEMETQALEEGSRLAADAAEPTDGDAAEDSAPAAGRAQAPVIVSQGQVLADEADVRAGFTGLPEAQGLLGLAEPESTDTAAAFRVAVQRAEPFPSGVQPASCLDSVTGGAEGPAAVVRVEEVTYAGEASLVYVVVLADGDGRFERVEGWVLGAESCAPALWVNLR